MFHVVRRCCGVASSQRGAYLRRGAEMQYDRLPLQRRAARLVSSMPP